MSYAQRVLSIFLPVGFPASVTEDYVGFVSPHLLDACPLDSIYLFIFLFLLRPKAYFISDFASPTRIRMMVPEI